MLSETFGNPAIQMVACAGPTFQTQFRDAGVWRTGVCLSHHVGVAAAAEDQRTDPFTKLGFVKSAV